MCKCFFFYVFVLLLVVVECVDCFKSFTVKISVLCVTVLAVRDVTSGELHGQKAHAR